MMQMRGLALACLLAACGAPSDGYVEAPVGDPATATLGAAGGTLTSNDGRLTLTIPAGALDGDTEITIQEIEWEDGRGWSLAPDGLTLAMPVTATITLSEDEVGVPTETVVDGEESLELPVPAFGHASPTIGAIEENVDVDVAWREAEGVLDYALPLEHFSTVFYIYTPRGRFTRRAELGLGENGILFVGSRTAEQDITLLFSCSGELVRHRTRTPRGHRDEHARDRSHRRESLRSHLGRRRSAPRAVGSPSRPRRDGSSRAPGPRGRGARSPRSATGSGASSPTPARTSARSPIPPTSLSRPMAIRRATCGAPAPARSARSAGAGSARSSTARGGRRASSSRGTPA